MTGTTADRDGHAATPTTPEAQWQIHRRVTAREFPWDYGRGLEVAMLHTFCVPSIAAVLTESGELRDRGPKRYDDTRILLGEVVRHGHDSERGRTAIRRINRAHRPYDITNADMLYVLSTFVLEPVRWIDRWARRPMTAAERLAGFEFYRELGRRLGVTGIPHEYAEFEDLNLEFERTRFAPTRQGHRLATDLLNVYASLYPAAVRAVAVDVWHARLGAPVRAALGLPGPSGPGRLLNHAVLRGHAALEHVAPNWCTAAFARPEARTFPGYPHGYDLNDIGPRCPVAPRASAQVAQSTDTDRR